MTEKEINIVVDKLKSLEKGQEKQSEELAEIRKALESVAVQKEQIIEIQKGLTQLWGKMNALLNPEGTISKMKEFQNSCPAKSIKDELRRQWTVIALLATAISGGLLKAFGVF